MLSIAAKAGKVVSGGFMTERALQDGSACLVIIADDASDNTKKLFKDKSSYRNVPYVYFSSKLQLGYAIGKAPRAALGVKDVNFANKILELMETPKI